MLTNYFKIAWRNIKTNKFISFINLFGLTIGFTCCLLITIYLLNELSFDRYNKNAKDIYRVERTFLNTDTKTVSLKLGAVAPPFGPLLTNDFTEIREATRILTTGDAPFQYGDKIFTQKNIAFAEANIFRVFDISLIKGNPQKALSEPFSLILTETTAAKYFGKEDPINKVIRFNNDIDFKVTGIYKALPGNAHWHPEALVSFSTLNNPNIYGEEGLRTNWGNNSFYTYLLLPPHYNPALLEKQFPAFQDRHISSGSINKASDYSVLSLRKLTDIHLRAHTDSEIEINGDIKRVYIFSAIALFILLIACINYMNLSSARAVLRAKEIGIRKTSGASRRELVAQFLSESVFIAWLAALMAFLLTFLALPWMVQLSGQPLSLTILFTGKVLPVILIMPFVAGLLSGIYPAFYLSGFQPAKVLKGIIPKSGGNISFQKTLVVFQFAISIILIVATLIVFQQMHYIQNKSLGFQKENIITLAYNSGLDKEFNSFKTNILSNSNIRNVSKSTRVPSGRLLDSQGSQLNRGDSLAPSKADIKDVEADENFIPTYGIKMVAGRNFSKDFGLDTASFLINEMTVQALGLQTNEDAIGKQFQYGSRTGEIVGVFKDFNFESLHQRIIPLVLYEPLASSTRGGTISIKIAGNVPSALAHVEQTWKEFLPNIPFEYQFLDERYVNLYQAENRQSRFFTIFSSLAIFIASLGLLGLSAFAISRRVKEIGIRKVLGASIRSIVQLVSKDFLWLITFAALIAFPIAWFAMNYWLQDFAYHIQIGWGVFVLAAAFALLIALLTISTQAIKAAMANPVESLRTE